LISSETAINQAQAFPIADGMKNERKAYAGRPVIKKMATLIPSHPKKQFQL